MRLIAAAGADKQSGIMQQVEVEAWRRTVRTFSLKWCRCRESMTQVLVQSRRSPAEMKVEFLVSYTSEKERGELEQAGLHLQACD